LGVGNDPNQTELIKNPAKWQGNNMYGTILMELRKDMGNLLVVNEEGLEYENNNSNSNSNNEEDEEEEEEEEEEEA
jgi:hypothetical protein